MNFARFRNFRVGTRVDDEPGQELDPQIRTQLEHERRLETTACGICFALGFLLGMVAAICCGMLLWQMVYKPIGGE